MLSLIIVLLLIAVLVTALFVVRQHQAVHTVVRIDSEPEDGFHRTLRVTADRDYDPYSFFDPAGRPSGHDVELLYTLASRMQYNVEVELLPWTEALDAVKTGTADMVLTVAYSPDEYPTMDLSIPLVNDPFVAFGSNGFKRIGELYGSRLAVLADTGCIPGFIVPYRLTENTTEYGSVSEVFGAVESGACDYAILRYSVGRRAMADRQGSDIKAVGPTLLNNYVCIGVPAGRNELLKQLNDAIISVSADGTLAALSEKWLGHYVDTLTFQDYLAANLDTFLYILDGLLVAFLVGILLISRSMAARKETILKKLAERDQLTGLYNRSTCENIIRETLNSSDPGADVHALLVIDMDNFKMINDTFGHMEGDAALVRLASGLSRLFRTGDVVGRLGGDEFFVFMTNCTDGDAPLQKARQIGQLFKNTYRVNDAEVNISASIGIALFPREGISFAALYKSADDALYEAKRRGKGGYAFRDASGEVVRFSYGDDPETAERR